MGEIIRVGRVSDVNYQEGTISVYYEDKTSAVTSFMPSLSNGEYNMPSVGQMVVVAHLSNDTTNAVVLGTIWNQGNQPTSSGKDVFGKDLTSTTRLEAQNGDIILTTSQGKLSINDLMNRLDDLETSEEGGE